MTTRIGQGCTLLLGGARSGKSDLAVRLARTWSESVVLVATAEAFDADMAARIERHQDDRPAEWGLVESPLLSATEVANIDATALVIVDCITVLVSNLMHADLEPEQINEHATALAQVLAARRSPSLVVSNEVGLGVHPATELGRSYRDVLGRYNRRLAEHAETSLFVAAGQVIPLQQVEAAW